MLCGLGCCSSSHHLHVSSRSDWHHLVAVLDNSGAQRRWHLSVHCSLLGGVLNFFIKVCLCIKLENPLTQTNRHGTNMERGWIWVCIVWGKTCARSIITARHGVKGLQTPCDFYPFFCFLVLSCALFYHPAFYRHCLFTSLPHRVF